ncbi:hypothetical protein INR49_027005 [Caranx melampygus]|nr:hypothetical protein INR49_027005 [Caranx melampygus]
MPTNQSSPWGGGKLRACSNADSPATATPVSTHAKTVAATKVPFSQTSLELSRRKDQAKPLCSHVASSASPLRQTTAVPSAASLWENRDGRKTNNQSQFTAVPDWSPTLPQQLNGIQIPNQVLAAGLKQPGSSPSESSAPSSIPKKECQIGFNGVAMDTVRSSTPENGFAMKRRQDATGDAPLELQALWSLCHEDLFIQGQPAVLQANTDVLEAADCCTLPSVPPLCLTPGEHRGATLGQDAPSVDSTPPEIRSTAREATTKRCQSAKAATKCCQTQNSCTIISDLNNQLRVLGGPPAVLAATTNSKAPTMASQDVNKQATESQYPAGSTLSSCRRIGPPEVSPFPSGRMPTVLSASVSASQEQQPPPADIIPGTSVGSVTTQISTIHLTKQGQPSSMSSSSSSPSSPSPLMTEDCLVGETRVSGSECVMQVDGGEEELPDELENACSDDDDSDCSSINGASSTASITLLSG